MKKENQGFWAYLAPIADFTWSGYVQPVLRSVPLVMVILWFQTWIHWKAFMPVGDSNVVMKLLHVTVVAFFAMAFIYVVAGIFLSLIAHEAFKCKWHQVTGRPWSEAGEHDPWSQIDKVMMELAMKVHECDGDATEFKEIFWTAHFIATTIEGGHPFHGRPRKIGDITHYVKAYQEQHQNAA